MMQRIVLTVLSFCVIILAVRQRMIYPAADPMLVFLAIPSAFYILIALFHVTSEKYKYTRRRKLMRKFLTKDQ